MAQNLSSYLRSCVLILAVVTCENRGLAFDDSRVTGSIPIVEIDNSPSDIGKAAIIEGDIVLGGLFPIHTERAVDNGLNGVRQAQCGTLNFERGIHRVEAMLYAVQMINKNSSLLPNITLGAQARDTCNLDNLALEESLHFIAETLSQKRKLFQCPNSASAQSPGQSKSNQSRFIAGVVGAASSAVSIQVAHLLRLFRLPQISYASTSPDLSNKAKYEYFLRTVPSDSNQARAMVDIVKTLNWTSVFTVYSEGNYGQRGISEFHKFAKAANICVVDSWMIHSNADERSFDEKINGFLNEKNTRAVVVFCTDNDARKVLESARRAKAVGRFIWLASDYWGTRLKPIAGLEEIAEGAITINPRAIRSRGFEEYFKRLNPISHTNNPWFNEFWARVFNCSLHTNTSTPCEPKKLNLETLPQNIDDKVPFVIDAVYAFAHALNKIYKAKCPRQDGVCQAMLSHNGEDLLDVLKSSSFQGVTGEVAFDKNGDATGQYDIYRFVKGKYMKGVASWRGGRLQHADRLHAGDIPESFCGRACKPGYYKLRLTHACCWECIACGGNRYVKDEIRCLPCKTGEIPNKSRTGCDPLPIRMISKNWIIVVMFSASLGLFLTIVVFIIFLMFNNTPLVKASGRELTYTLLAGLTLCYLVSLCLMLEPTLIVCGLQRLGIGFCFSVCYSALLIKTNRIARIFRKSERSTKPPSFINPASQMFILAVFLTIEVGLVSIGLIKWPPKPVRDFPTQTDVLLICNVTDYDLIISLTYNVLLIALCTWFAVMTRKTPANFNEARFIGFAMYTTCIIWIAFIPVHFGVNKDYAQITLAVTTVLNASTLLLCIFGPKLYILLFRPARNVRSRSLQSNTWRDVDFVNSSLETPGANHRIRSISGLGLKFELGSYNPTHNGDAVSEVAL